MDSYHTLSAAPTRWVPNLSIRRIGGAPKRTASHRRRCRQQGRVDVVRQDAAASRAQRKAARGLTRHPRYSAHGRRERLLYVFAATRLERQRGSRAERREACASARRHDETFVRHTVLVLRHRPPTIDQPRSQRAAARRRRPQGLAARQDARACLSGRDRGRHVAELSQAVHSGSRRQSPSPRRLCMRPPLS